MQLNCYYLLKSVEDFASFKINEAAVDQFTLNCLMRIKRPTRSINQVVTCILVRQLGQQAATANGLLHLGDISCVLTNCIALQLICDGGKQERQTDRQTLTELNNNHAVGAV